MAMQQNQNMLIVRPLRAKIEDDFNKKSLNPYCLLRIGNQVKYTDVCFKGGLNPFWDNIIRFDLSGQDENFNISIWHKGRLVPDFEMCSSQIPLSRITASKTFDDWIELHYEGRKIGVIRLFITYNLTKTQHESQSQEGLVSINLSPGASEEIRYTDKGYVRVKRREDEYTKEYLKEVSEPGFWGHFYSGVTVIPFGEREIRKSGEKEQEQSSMKKEQTAEKKDIRQQSQAPQQSSPAH
ncbi:unnamed protein product [Blepharisma stoltei]|uniref:C2 domain-containing protein n=1 Tax=Blepharisma stoltei TaxID=1481888 RepID=A0AAU9JUI6_9CILI|nr:unnamed protein product [Blepharisma stoltei]